jgi:hypothetical protein
MVVWGQGAGRGIGAAPSWVRCFVASGPSTGVVHVTLLRTMGGSGGPNGNGGVGKGWVTAELRTVVE